MRESTFNFKRVNMEKIEGFVSHESYSFGCNLLMFLYFKSLTIHITYIEYLKVLIKLQILWKLLIK